MLNKNTNYMNTNLKQLLSDSGKKTVVTYKDKDKRIKFDETTSQKKMENISDFIGNQSQELAKKLSK